MGIGNLIIIIIRTLINGRNFYSLKWHYEVFRWFDLYLRKDTADAEI